jgi:cytosine deaminase
MKSFFCFLCVYFLGFSSWAQGIPVEENATPDRPALMQKLVALPCGILESDTKKTVLAKLATFLQAYQPDPAYPDDALAKASVMEALKGVQSGGYGIGAVIAERNGKVLMGRHNAQLQKKRSDLHAEMHLLNEFEDHTRLSKRYLNALGFTGSTKVYSDQVIVFSSAEPCPMCFVRLAIAGVETRFVTTGPDDGMVERAACLPPFWATLSQENTVKQADTAPVLQRIAHALFFSFLL